MKVLFFFSDSLIFDIEKGRFPDLVEKLQINSPSYGYYKEEVKSDIISFFSLGCKNYAISTADPSESILKVRGFTLKHQEFLTSKDMHQMIEEFLQDKKSSKTHCQFQMKLNRATGSVRSSEVEKKYANDTFDKRFIYNNMSACAESLPYGTVHF